MIYQRPRGTTDLYGSELNKFNKIIEILKFLAKLNGYEELKTPIFEHKELFIRSVGETSDIVKKEFYDFTDKSDRQLVLRPEGTAGIIRAVIENKILAKTQLPVRYFYFGPMFRYERPQDGRQRQFHQFGVEMIGTNNLYDDVDLLNFAISILDALNIKNYQVKINNLGDFKSRTKWVDDLKQYFKKFVNQLSPDSVARIDTNPLRILDDKIDGKKEFVLNAPALSQYLSKTEKEEFELLQKTLTTLKVDYIFDKNLVRGLDYYSKFVFEINYLGEQLQGQPTIIGGGRYNNLVEELGGSNCECLGFAVGIERLLIAANAENALNLPPPTVDVLIATLTDNANDIACAILRILRASGISSIANFTTVKLDKHFKYAQKNNVKFVILIGEKELKTKKFIIKNQQTLKQTEMPIEAINDFLQGQLKK